MRKTILAACVAAAALVVPATASASSTTIDLPQSYRHAFPAVDKVRAINLPRKLDGYAPRWLVAESAVGVIQARTYNGGFPRRIWLRGASWDGGRWRVRVRTIVPRDGDAYGKVTVARGDMRLVFRGYS